MDDAPAPGHPTRPATAPPPAPEPPPAFAQRVFDAALGFAETTSIILGQRLGWYRALAAAGAPGLTADELAAHTATTPRYAHEWLEQQAVAALVDVVPDAADPEPAFRRFRLPEGAAAVLTEPDSLESLTPVLEMLLAGVAQLPAVEQAYRDGGGVSWAQLGDAAREAQAAGNRPWFEQRLAPALQAAPEVHALLSLPRARVVDIGCGFGWSTLALARAYPEATVLGLDIDAPSVLQAQRLAAAAGLEDRVRFELADATEPRRHEPYDVAFIFEALHDLPFPVSVLSTVHAMMAPGGAVVVMEEAVAEDFAPPGDAVERLMYVYSLLICLPDSLSTPGSVGTGTVLRPATLERYALAAGFSAVERLPIEDFSVFRFYRLHL